jgi:hypothetical protein
MKSNVLPIPNQTYTVTLSGEDLETILFRLTGERARIDNCIGKFQSALNPVIAPKEEAPTTKRKLTPAGRKAIANAQKKRHAKKVAPAAGTGVEEPKTMTAGGGAPTS